MKKSNSGGQTPPRVALAATRQVDIPRDKPLLVGIFGTDNALQALVRLPGGRITTVRQGQRLRGQRVMAIDVKGVLLGQGPQQERLALP